MRMLDFAPLLTSAAARAAEAAPLAEAQGRNYFAQAVTAVLAIVVAVLLFRRRREK